MQSVVETVFDAAYLITVITLGILMIRRSGQSRQFRLFGWMAVVLGGRRLFPPGAPGGGPLHNRPGKLYSSFGDWKMDHIRYNDRFLCTALLCLETAVFR